MATYGAYRRHWTVAVVMQLAIRFKYMILQWAGLKPFIMGLTSRRAFSRPKNAPNYDMLTQIGFMSIWLIVGLLRVFPIFYAIACKIGFVSLLSNIQEWLSHRLIRRMKAQGWDNSQGEIPTPEFDWKNKSADEFYRTFVATGHPVVLRGFMSNTELLEKVTFENILKQYGDEKVILTTPEKDGAEGQLKDVNKPNVYLQNSEVLTRKYTWIRDLLKYETLEPYMRRKVAFDQMFIGRCGTGTPMHRAGTFNFFFMIDGVKKWWFVDPYDTFLVYPLAVMGYYAGIPMMTWPGEGNTKDFPLLKYCPVYSVELQPGDVLYNPPVWWHGTKNLSPTSVAVASRWLSDGKSGHNLMAPEEDYESDRFFSLAFNLGVQSWFYMHHILTVVQPQYDEHQHLTKREQNARHGFIDIQKGYNANGGVTVLGATIKA